MIDLVPVTHKKNELRIAKPIKISTNRNKKIIRQASKKKCKKRF